MYGPWFFGHQTPPKPATPSRPRYSVCRHCVRVIRAEVCQGHRFWSVSGDTICNSNPLRLRPFGGEHEPLEGG